MPPGIVEIYFTRFGFKTDESATQERESPTSTINSGEDRTRVTREFIGDLVDDLTRVFVKGDDAASVWVRSTVRAPNILRAARWRAAYLDDEQLAFDCGG